MLRQVLLCAATVALLSSAAVHAQEVTAIDKGSSNIIFAEPLTPQPTEWTKVDKNTDWLQLQKQLEGYGWAKKDVLATLDPSVKYDVYERAFAPGVKGVLAVPDDPKAMPVSFVPNLAAPGVQPVATQASLFNKSPDDIKAELVKQLQASIEAVCGMKRRPQTVKITVSAFSFVSAEATWDTKEACAP